MVTRDSISAVTAADPAANTAHSGSGKSMNLIKFCRQPRRALPNTASVGPEILNGIDLGFVRIHRL